MYTRAGTVQDFISVRSEAQPRPIIKSLFHKTLVSGGTEARKSLTGQPIQS
jgi:hypothetical protein